MPSIRVLTVFAVLLVASGSGAIVPAYARGGGVPNLLNSPGYQRALDESRKRYRDSVTEPAVVHHPSRTRRHRHHR